MDQEQQSSRYVRDDAPVFIIGTGRCGSTLFHDLLARHPRVSYLTKLANQHPTRPELNRAAMKSLDVPGLRWAARRKWHPVEAYHFWDHYYHGFSSPFRDLTSEDALPVVVRKLRPALAQLASPTRPHLICKITGWPRIGFLQSIYPNAKFINVIRDGRATVNSLLQVDWAWDGWQGPAQWKWGPLSSEREQRWQNSGRSFVALAALEWEILMEAYEQAKNVMSSPERLLEVRYEDLCADPMLVVRAATEFAGLEFSGEFKREIERFQVRDRNDKWQRDLSTSQQTILSDCIHDTLEHWGYPSGAAVRNKRWPKGEASYANVTSPAPTIALIR